MRNLLWLSAALLCAQGVIQTGFQITTFPSAVDDTDQPYGLFVPKGYTPAKRYPLVVMLHGSMSDHRTDLKRLFGRGTAAGDGIDFLAVTPHARGWAGYQGLSERDVWDVLADVKKRFSVDDDRIYLTGLGTGGGGAVWLALSKPGVWAAVAPVSALVPRGVAPLMPNGANVPWKIFQGAADPLVKREHTRGLVDELRATGANVEYVEYTGVRHNAWDLAYRNSAIFAWFATHKRDRYSNWVRFVTDTYRNTGVNWLRFVHFTPGTLAEADARFTAPKQLEIETKNLDALELDVAAHPMNQGSGFLRIRIDRTLLTTATRKTVNLSRSPRGWILRAAPPRPGEKMAGLEGPIADSLISRHIYVYGTLDSPPPPEVLKRKRDAEYAADWNRAKNNILVSFEVKADAEITPKDRKESHLILFGTRETNEVIAQLAPKLPMRLSPAAADYGLIYITPSETGRYVVVNSGLPWWTRVDSMEIDGHQSVPAPFQILSRYGDFALFRGAGDKVLVEGRFDQHWRLSAAQADALRATRVVTLTESSRTLP